MNGICPLCTSPEARASWLGALRYAGREFPYAECTGCGSLYADPMPDEATLARMYGAEYASLGDADGVDDPKEPRRVLAWLSGRQAGLFIDYGCGSGILLSGAGRLGWRTQGVEFDPDIAETTARRVGAPVASRFTVDQLPEGLADVLHLGDVIEHLVDPDAEMAKILRLIKPGGHLIAQGPLEANTTLFTSALKWSRRLRGTRVSDMAPYHVMLATAAGQRAFFSRFGLRPVDFRMHEVGWPAPSRLGPADLFRPRALVLFALRRVSQVMSTLRPNRWGNRYFYVGQRL